MKLYKIKILLFRGTHKDNTKTTYNGKGNRVIQRDWKSCDKQCAGDT